MRIAYTVSTVNENMYNVVAFDQDTGAYICNYIFGSSSRAEKFKHYAGKYLSFIPDGEWNAIKYDHAMDVIYKNLTKEEEVLDQKMALIKLGQ